ncbi:MAG TPA: hypothetical protein VFW05_15980 [Verrucomicrobiae bacterium]|nr:hypothetical protein [Verrucomicrobiae bacterium]
MARLTKRWLAPFDWELVTEINRGLCQQKGALHKPTSDGHTPAKNLWQKSQSEELTLTEAIDICLKCHKLAPFCFYNGNTFAAIARDFIIEMSKDVPPDKVHILRSIAGHIVAGTATDVERRQLEDMLSEVFPPKK